MESDKKLLEAIARKDKNAYETFYARYHKIVSTRLMVLLKNKELSKDLSQELWLTVWTKPESIKTNEDDSAIGFLYYFTSIRAYEFFRTEMRKGVMVSTDELTDSDKKLWKQLQYSHVYEDLENDELAINIEVILGTLPPFSREVYNLCQNEHYSVHEAALKLSKSDAYVHNRLSWTLQIIRKRLGKFYFEEGIKDGALVISIILKELF